MHNRDTVFMAEAIKEAEKAYREDEVPVGAVIVIGDKIIASEHNRKEQLHDPTAHAEVLVIRKASEVLGRWRLTDATLYVTKEPCPMCAGAILNARLKRLVFGCKDQKAGAVQSLYRLLQDSRLNHTVEVMGGILDTTCAELLQRFFHEKRRKTS